MVKLEDEQRKSLDQTSHTEQSIKIYFDQRTIVNNFQKGDLVLLWNEDKEKLLMHAKFEALCIGPFFVKKILGFNFYMLQDMNGKIVMLPINRKHLKGFFS